MGRKLHPFLSFRPVNLETRSASVKAKGATKRDEDLIAALATRNAPEVASRRATRAATPSIAKSIARPSLWAPPTTWTRTSGLRATKAAARASSTPRQAASRDTTQARPRTETAATAFSTAIAAQTGSQARG